MTEFHSTDDLHPFIGHAVVVTAPTMRRFGQATTTTAVGNLQCAQDVRDPENGDVMLTVLEFQHSAHPVTIQWEAWDGETVPTIERIEN